MYKILNNAATCKMSKSIIWFHKKRSISVMKWGDKESWWKKRKISGTTTHQKDLTIFFSWITLLWLALKSFSVILMSHLVICILLRVLFFIYLKQQDRNSNSWLVSTYLFPLFYLPYFISYSSNYLPEFSCKMIWLRNEDLTFLTGLNEWISYIIIENKELNY
jgi:hypothetical protein